MSNALGNSGTLEHKDLSPPAKRLAGAKIPGGRTLRPGGPPGPPLSTTESAYMKASIVHRVRYLDAAGRRRTRLYTQRRSADQYRDELIAAGKAGVVVESMAGVWITTDPTPRDETAPERSVGPDDRWPGMLEELRVQGRMPFAPIREWMNETRDEPSVHGDGPRWDAWYELYEGGLVSTDVEPDAPGEPEVIATAHTQRLDGGR